MKTTILLLTALAFFSFKSQAQTVTDYDGNVYDTVKIGAQIWLKQNLKVTHYRNGDPIQLVTDATAWSNLSTAAYCNYDNDTNNVATYGRLYNWYAVTDIRAIAPTGYHVPTHAEWTALTDYLGGESISGGKLKETGTTHWAPPNTGATNETGFTALPGGYREFNGGFYYLGAYGYWWSSTEWSTTHAWSRYMTSQWATVSSPYNGMLSGFSLRCIKDDETGIGNINYLHKIRIFPNPASDLIIIECTETQNAKMQVYNMNGVSVILRELNNGINNIDIGSLSKGVYVIKIGDEQGTVQERFVKK